MQNELESTVKGGVIFCWTYNVDVRVCLEAPSPLRDAERGEQRKGVGRVLSTLGEASSTHVQQRRLNAMTRT